MMQVWFQNRRIKWRKQHLEQQKAKLGSLDIYGHVDFASESEAEEEHHVINRMTGNEQSQRHIEALADPFQSPRESRATQ